MKQVCPSLYDDVREGTIVMGMPEECLLASRGIPLRKNETCHSNTRCLTQYVYHSTYVYVKNGKITSWQSY